MINCVLSNQVFHRSSAQRVIISFECCLLSIGALLTVSILGILSVLFFLKQTMRQAQAREDGLAVIAREADKHDVSDSASVFFAGFKTALTCTNFDLHVCF